MRDRSVLWDIAIVLLLLASTVFNFIVLLQNNNIEKHLVKIEKGQGRVSATDGAAPAPQNTVIKPITAKLYDGSDNPKFERGDEMADDGDELVVAIPVEPNSLNPIVDNDGFGGDLFGRANDSLVGRCFDDLKYWEPRLARAWEKSMICRAVAAKRNARELAENLNHSIAPETREKLSIAKIEAESDDILRIEVVDVNNEYRDEVARHAGVDALARQYWIYVDFDGLTFSDGAPLNAETAGARLTEAIRKAPGFTGSFLPLWKREGSVVIVLTGDGKIAEKAVKDYIESSANSGEIIDQKSATGKKTGKVLSFSLVEDYLFEEKPVFTFYLRKDVKWHDGAAFSGKDMIFTFNTVRNPRIQAAHLRNYYQDCESLKLVNDDPYVVQFVWKKPYFLSFNFSAGFTVLPEHIFKFDDPEQFNKGPQNQTLIGTGNYRLESWVRKQRFVFVRNEDYYGRKPHFKRMVVKVVSDPTVALQMLIKQDLDDLELTKPQAFEKSKDTEFLKSNSVNAFVASVYRYIGWNEKNPLFKSAKVRRALSMLTDRQRIIDDCYRGYGIPLNGPAHPYGPSYSPEVEKYAVQYDPAGAKKLLEEEGWKDTDGDGVIDKDGMPFKFTLMIRANKPEYESIANLLKDSYAQAGIQVNISNLEWSIVTENLKHLNFEATIMGWQMGVEDDPYQLWHSSQAIPYGSNHCSFINPEVDKLIETGRRELDDKKRNAMYARVQEIIAREQPYTFLLAEKRTVATANRLKNVVFKWFAEDTDRWWVPKAEQKYK